MKIPNLLPKNNIVSSAVPQTVRWLGRDVTPFVKNALSVAVFATFVVCVALLLRRYLAKEPFHLSDEQADKLLEQGKTCISNGQPIECSLGIVVWQILPESTLEQVKINFREQGVEGVICLPSREETLCYWKNWPSITEEEIKIFVPPDNGGWVPKELWLYNLFDQKGVPTDINHFIDFVRSCRSKYKQSKVMVHGGDEGPLGIFIMAILMLDHLEKGTSKLNPSQYFMTLSRAYPGIIKTRQQLKFCFDVAKELLKT